MEQGFNPALRREDREAAKHDRVCNGAGFSLTRVGVVFGGGVRFYPANHLVVGTEAGVMMLLGDARRTSSTFGDLATWTVESERRLFAVFQVGLAF